METKPTTSFNECNFYGTAVTKEHSDAIIALAKALKENATAIAEVSKALSLPSEANIETLVRINYDSN